MGWPGQKNGRIPADLMQDVGGGKLLHPAAAYWWLAMQAACFKAVGGRVYIAGYQDAYRSLAEQWKKWFISLAGGSTAARPGTSNHGWGMAVDVTYASQRVRSWVHANAAEFNYQRDPHESWHWNYIGSLTVPTKPTSKTTRRKIITWLL